MRKILRATALLLILILLFPTAHVSAVSAKNSFRTYLVAGFDDANANTDVMAVISYDRIAGRVTVLQIPRDTYYDFGGVQNKLNQLYPYTLGSGTSKKEKKQAMERLVDAVSDCLGFRPDGYIGVSIRAFSDMIDSVGGVSVTLPFSISFRDPETGEELTLPEGRQTLSGGQAVRFIRYRLGYLRGDLDRIDAQKIFISALLRQFGESFGIRMLTTVFGEMRRGMVTDITFTEALRCAVQFMTHYGESDVRYLTLPGEAARLNGSSGVWYYVANREAAADAIRRWVLPSYRLPAEFDPSRRLLCSSSPVLSEIYQRPNMGYRVYSDSELKELDIRFK